MLATQRRRRVDSAATRLLGHGKQRMRRHGTKGWRIGSINLPNNFKLGYAVTSFGKADLVTSKNISNSAP